MTPPPDVAAYFKERGFVWHEASEQFSRLLGGVGYYIGPVKRRVPPFDVLCWTASAVTVGGGAFACRLPVKEEDQALTAISCYVSAELREWKG